MYLPKAILEALFASAIAIAPVQIHPNHNSGKCLTVAGNNFANGTAVHIFDCHPGSKAQKWLIHPGNTKVQLAGTNFCLDAGSNPGNNVRMKIWKCIDRLPAQDWFYTGDLRIALTGKGQCLDLTDGITINGNPVQTFQCTSGDTNQIWSMSPFRHSVQPFMDQADEMYWLSEEMSY